MIIGVSHAKCPREHCGGTLMFEQEEYGGGQWKCTLCGHAVHPAVKADSATGRLIVQEGRYKRENPSYRI